MTNESITKEDLIKLEENLGRIIAKGFEENSEQHRQIFDLLNNHTERLDRIEKRLEGVVYRRELKEQ